MSVHIHKIGIRALGISESFVKDVSKKSVLAGVVMRADMIIDGFTFSTASVGGMDSTQCILEMYQTLDREDINVLLLNGCVISWYNVIDLHHLANMIGLPLICVTYKESDGLERHFVELFPEDWQSRVNVYQRNGKRIPLKVKTDHVIYVRFLEISEEETLKTINKFTIHGAIPEPLRIARLLARSIMKSKLFSSKPSQKTSD